MWRPGSSPGGEGVLVRRAAAFLAASSVGVARSPRVGVPSIPRVVSGAWWVCTGVIRTASDACFGGLCWGVRPRESWGVRWGWGGAGPPVVVCPSWVWVVAFAVVPFSSVPWSPLPPLPGSWPVSCPHVVSLPASCPEAVAAESPYRYPLWLTRALNSAIYDVKWDYEGYRAIARIAVFYVEIAVFYNKFMLLCLIL